MNSRTPIAVVFLGLLLAGVATWWMLGSKTKHAPPIPKVESPAPTPSEPARLDVADKTPSTPSFRQRIEPAAPAAAKAPRSTLRRTQGIISGRVTSAADGAEIIGAYVHLERIGEAAPLDPPIADYSDFGGTYSIYAIPEGEWRLVCSAHSYTKAEVRVTMTRSGEKQQQDFRLQADPGKSLVLHLSAPGGGSLFDHLRAEDAALVDLLRPVFVDACPARGADLPAGTSVMTFQGRAIDHVHSVTDEWQRVVLRSAKPGCCAVLLGDRVLDAAAFTTDSSDLTLVVSMEDLYRATGWLHVQVVDAATDAPIPGARVSLRNLGALREVITDAAGRAEFAHVLPGEGICDTAAAGHPTAPRKVTIQAGNQTDLCTIRLPSVLVVSGTIDMPAPTSGAAQTGVPVYACRAADQDFMAVEIVIRSNADGTFEFPQLFSGEYVIGWRHGDPPPEPGAVRRGEVPGWIYLDARAAGARGLHIAVTPSMWSKQNVGTSR